MQYYLRIIKKPIWIDCISWRNNNKNLTDKDDITADLISDFKTNNNCLSLWLVDDQQSNLSRILSGWVCTKQRIEEIEYSLIPSDIFSNNGFKIKKTTGKSKDFEANGKWHYDVEDLSGNALLKLAKLYFHNTKPETKYVDDMRNLIVQSYNNNHITKKLQRTLKEEIEELIRSN